jgi:hypothetical protein
LTMAQYHEGQEVEIIEVYASLTARKTEVLRKAKIVSANLEHGVNLGSQYLVEFSDGSRLVIDQGHIRPFRA